MLDNVLQGCQSIAQGEDIATVQSRLLLALGMTTIRHGVHVIQDFIASFRQEATQVELGRLDHEGVPEEDFLATVRAAIADDERAKTTIYASLLRAIALGKVPNDSKARALKIARNLTSSELKTLQRVYVVANFDIVDDFGTLTPQFEINNLSVDALEIYRSNGLLHPVGNHLEPTPLAASIARWLFSTRQLTPEGIGRKAYRPFPVLLMSPSLQENEQLLSRVSRFLHSRRLRVSQSSTDPSRFALLNYKCVILIAGRQALNPRHREAIDRAVRGRFFIKGLVGDETGGAPADPVPDIRAGISFHLSNGAEGTKDLETFFDELMNRLDADSITSDV